MWEKAKIKTRSGGGKLQAVPPKGDKGLPPISGVSKSQVGRMGGKVIDAVQTKGDRGLHLGGAGAQKKAPLD